MVTLPMACKAQGKDMLVTRRNEGAYRDKRFEMPFFDCKPHHHVLTRRFNEPANDLMPPEVEILERYDGHRSGENSILKQYIWKSQVLENLDRAGPFFAKVRVPKQPTLMRRRI